MNTTNSSSMLSFCGNQAVFLTFLQSRDLQWTSTKKLLTNLLTECMPVRLQDHQDLWPKCSKLPGIRALQLNLKEQATAIVQKAKVPKEREDNFTQKIYTRKRHAQEGGRLKVTDQCMKALKRVQNRINPFGAPRQNSFGGPC